MARESCTRTILRDELYKEVWKTPMYKLAEKYGLSNVGLKKICKKLKVPTPPRGHWARLEHGYKVDQTPLPPIAPDEPRTYTLSLNTGSYQSSRNGIEPKRYSDDASELMRRFQKNMPIIVQNEPKNLHRLVSRTHKGLEKAKPSTSNGLYYPKGSSCLNIVVSKDNIARAMLVADALVKFLELQGIRIKTEKPGEPRATCIELFDEKIEFEIKESLDRYEVEPPKNSLWYRKTYRYEPNGKLYLFINGSGGHLRRTWADGKKKRIEELINGFVLGLVKVADYERVKRIEFEEWKRRWDEERRREKQIQETIRLDQERQKDLEELTKLWVHSDQVRRFIATAEAKAEQQELSKSDKRKFELWKIWAKAHADRLDPLRIGLPHKVRFVREAKPGPSFSFQWQ